MITPDNPAPEPQGDRSDTSKEEQQSSLTTVAGRLRAVAAESPELAHKANYLTDLDLMLAALNGVSDQINYVVPPKPATASESTSAYVRRVRTLMPGRIPDDLLVVAKDTDSALFYHCMNAAAIDGLVPRKQVPQIIETGFITTNRKVYMETLDLLQAAARHFAEHKERVVEDSAELIVGVNEQYQTGLLGAVFPTIEPSGVIPGQGLLLKMSTGEPLLQRLLPGSRVYIPGAGYNSLAMLDRLEAMQEFQFVLGDNDPLVCAVAQRLFQRNAPSKVSFLPGDAGKVQPEGEFDLAIVSNVHSIQPASATHLIENLSWHLKPGSPVYISQTNSEGEGITTSMATWRHILEDSKFQIEIEREFPFRSLSLIPDGPQDFVLQCSAEDLIGFMEVEKKEMPDSSGTDLIARLPRR